MKFTVVSILLFSFFMIFVANETSVAQNQQSRYSKQHKSHFLKEHLSQTEKMLVQALQSGYPNMESTAAQTVRELEQIYPSEQFVSLIIPLSQIVRDDKADTQCRVLSALALDGLHSDDGDKVIFDTAKRTSNESLKAICEALAVESFKAEDKISLR